jgi:hypothetical protein
MFRAKYGMGVEMVVRAYTLVGGKPVELVLPPTVIVKVKGRRAPGKVILNRAAGRAVHSGSMADLPVDQEIDVQVSATDRSGHTVRTQGRFLINPIDPEAKSAVNSPDGQLSLSIPAKALPGGARIAIGPTMADRSAPPSGYSVVSGPYAVSSNVEHSGHPVTVRFQLPQDLDRPGTLGFDQKTFRILRQDPSTRKWEDLEGKLLPHPIDIVTTHTPAFGIFVLVARPTREKPAPPEETPKQKAPGRSSSLRNENVSGKPFSR